MIWLLLGLILWTSAHVLRYAAPDLRGTLDMRLGADKARGPIALAIIAGVALMVIGYRDWDSDYVYGFGAWTVHINNLLVWVSFILFGLRGATGKLGGGLRHPMLSGLILWSVAHLLVNGTWADILLFGGIGAWGVLAMILIDRNSEWTPPAREPGIEWRRVFISTALYMAVGLLHGWLGPWPFGG